MAQPPKTPGVSLSSAINPSYNPELTRYIPPKNPILSTPIKTAKKKTDAPIAGKTYQQALIVKQTAKDKAREDVDQYFIDNPTAFLGEGDQVFIGINEEFDPKGTQVYRTLVKAETNYLDLINFAKQGGFESGIDSAGAYVASDRAQSSEAERAYNDYIGRISDMSALEKAELDRDREITDTYLKSIEMRNKTYKDISQGLLPGVFQSFSSQPKKSHIDYPGHIANIGRTLPGRTPEFRPVSNFGGGGGDQSEGTYPMYPDGELVIPWGEPDTDILTTGLLGH